MLSLTKKKYKMQEKTVSEAITYRRSVRVYTEEPIDTEKVKKCLVNASLAPTSSNLQLWEFFHITNISSSESANLYVVTDLTLCLILNF